ncbi:hypothetical protein [Legionella bozemanae]|nr:hypothetical protein [Legionella bozemanae]
MVWNKTFPPSSWEKQWALHVAAIEGYENPYIINWQENASLRMTSR